MPRLMRTLTLCTALVTCGVAGAESVMVTGPDLSHGPDGLLVIGGIDIPDLAPSANQLPPGIDEPAYQELRRHLRTQTSIGFGGFLYDNRDRGHSSVPDHRLPALLRVLYGIDIVAGGIDRGIAQQMLFPVPTIGNASLAYTGAPQSRSLPRTAMMNETGAERFARLYRSNHLYVFPEHRDHDAIDRFPANWPYTVVSQGSSGSDLPFVEALALTLAAVPADTFTAIKETGLVAPVLQMVLRRNLHGVDTESAYLSGRAHPAVFDAADMDVAAMVRHAASLRPDSIVAPPQLHVVAESFGEAEGLAKLSERLFDTPYAIARIWRGFDAVQSLSVSVAEGPATDGLRYHWRLLRGDPDLVRIFAIGAKTNETEISIGWHEAFPDGSFANGGTTARTTARVDIAVFAELNGAFQRAFDDFGAFSRPPTARLCRRNGAGPR
jgi:hypothetical protein